ncbi:MAG: hypothetical protein D6723_10870 [Acidobacteria bacterium]|nr:MAG: hypothetical protein D6723_10870 [Acidobacteriota bacterium]
MPVKGQNLVCGECVSPQCGQTLVMIVHLLLCILAPCELTDESEGMSTCSARPVNIRSSDTDFAESPRNYSKIISDPKARPLNPKRNMTRTWTSIQDRRGDRWLESWYRIGSPANDPRAFIEHTG